MDIIIDFTIPVSGESYFTPIQVMWYIIANGGWIVILATVLIGLWWSWITWRKDIYNSSIKFVLLAIDIPKENEQTPKAVENIFAHLHGIQKRGNNVDRWLRGYNQQGFSLEIISTGGYIQFLIRTPEQFRDMVEAAVYAQYPDAEITEVEDYTDSLGDEFPNDEFDIWGCQLKLQKKEVYPIKTYIAFEDKSTKEVFKDPMASLLEILSRLKENEQVWLQFVIVPPSNNKWREEGIRIVKKLIGAKEEKKKNNISWLPTEVAKGVSESLTAAILPTADLNSKDREMFKWPTMMQHLTPSEKSVVESVGIKISKIAFVTKIRLIYLAKKEIFSYRRIIPAVIGAMKQYNTLDMNGIRRDNKTKTKVVYPPINSVVEWRQNRRKKRIMVAYKTRSGVRGRCPFTLNIEELATLYHFPISTVKAPLVKKTEARKGEPPITLPTESAFVPKSFVNKPENIQPQNETEGPIAPGNLPFA